MLISTKLNFSCAFKDSLKLESVWFYSLLCLSWTTHFKRDSNPIFMLGHWLSVNPPLNLMTNFSYAGRPICNTELVMIYEIYQTRNTEANPFPFRLVHWVILPALHNTRHQRLHVPSEGLHAIEAAFKFRMYVLVRTCLFNVQRSTMPSNDMSPMVLTN